MASCVLNQIFLGEVASVQNYGAFVRIPGCKQQGLIHKSQVSSARVDDVAEVLQRGERVWCKVININEDGKVGLSMKHVNQGTGKDADPNGVEQQLDEQRRRKIVPGRKRTIELDAVFDTTCSKCGTRGHLANDCFTTPDGKKYDLVPEIEETMESSRNDDTVVKKEETTASTKKSKRKKRSKKSRQRSDGSSDDISDDDDNDDDDNDDNDNDSGESKRKRRKKKKSKDLKKTKKRKKQERQGESSSDGHKNRETKEKRREGIDKKSKKCKHSRSERSD